MVRFTKKNIIGKGYKASKKKMDYLGIEVGEYENKKMRM